jgi:hypothetical protein
VGAAKTRLTKYLGKDGAAVYAAKITEILPFSPPVGARTLIFGELKKRSNLVPQWVADHGPQVGGYFVVYDADGQTLCRYEPASSIENNYTRAVPA